ncbi:SGNH/GDSL hydrolase family protein [Pseudarthrobacter sp. NIBRBAC000502770]|uniref:SGNH/GDSL hydrolase family protein n=1 Tax=Pseudarthrobacter sp. NIBRBAC000502770 TaxID=2590785 RepID=UPI00113FCA17|nr:SGNH/GDSL hydrolase family protein [Pseudarthrobacter sp. NIBRBAC000502770]QDG89455.1 SGNH/GDSL hydrolase family protein [Pseudarthrobacter sp. NIBRBAC000502770]
MQFPVVWRRSAATFAAATALILSGASAPAFAAQQPVKYVNLGDSYSAGWGSLAPTAAVNPAFGSPACLHGGPDDVALFDQLQSVALTGDYACAGATIGTTTSGIPTIAQQAAKASRDGALNSTTGLVTLTAGGNDVNFGQIIGACAADPSPTAVGCREAVAYGVQLANGVDVVGTVAKIRGYAANAKIAWLGYPQLFATAGESTTVIAGGGVMSAAAAAVFDKGTDQLNAVLAGKARSAGAQFVDVTPKFNGHEIGSSDSWFNLGQYTQFNFHPTADGYTQGYYPAMVSAIKPAQLVKG